MLQPAPLMVTHSERYGLKVIAHLWELAAEGGAEPALQVERAPEGPRQPRGERQAEKELRRPPRVSQLRASHG